MLIAQVPFVAATENVVVTEMEPVAKVKLLPVPLVGPEIIVVPEIKEYITPTSDEGIVTVELPEPQITDGFILGD